MLRAVEGVRCLQHERIRDGGEPEVIEEIYQVTGRPIIVGEFHFACRKGTGSRIGQVRDLRSAARLPLLRGAGGGVPGFIGSSWFQWWTSLDGPDGRRESTTSAWWT